MLSPARDLKGGEEDEEEETKDENEPRKTGEAVVLGLTFSIYLLVGAKVLSVYEPEMDFFKAFYFNFVTLTTIGLGDFVPKSYDYLMVTLCYIGIGLALTTMAIELAADLLRKLHYVGRKMDNMANVVVWFGGKK
ncbi:Ion channel [Ancylostoma caninum]|uniref:Ion channel n=1 Tax=Ancylostoma caninum TaxID=29170 RepID=A0A368GIC8_ANCCA|nr:Ion channel [Ancylostoma caninum]